MPRRRRRATCSHESLELGWFDPERLPAEMVPSTGSDRGRAVRRVEAFVLELLARRWCTDRVGRMAAPLQRFFVMGTGPGDVNAHYGERAECGIGARTNV